MAPFKVIIVGGSVAGLALANILEQYGIDYILLEKHKKIAAQVGASLGTLPHGNKILAQLGVFDDIKAIAMPVKYVRGYGPDGQKVGQDTPFGILMSELCGSPFMFLERSEFLDILHKKIGDKSKIRVSARVIKIKELENGVTIELNDGSIIHGDVMVGADGAHSGVRDEMWRIADQETQGEYNSASLSQSIRCEYRCLFGISTRPKRYPGDKSVHSFHKGRSYFFTPGADNKLYFFVFQKNPKITIHREIPRYSQEDIDVLVADCARDPLIPGVSFTEIYAQAKTAIMVPLEEYVLEKCFYKRCVLIGDSFHKMNPLVGAGGNTALESAAVLADLLKAAIDNNHHSSKLDNAAIREIFSRFQEQRKPRAEQLMVSSKQMQHLEALDNFFMKFLQLKIVPRLGAETLAPVIAYLYTPGPSLKYLPPASLEGPVLSNEEVKVNPHDRSIPVSRCFFVMFILLSTFAPLTSHFLGVSKTPGEKDSQEMAVYQFLMACTITCFWTVESYRPAHLMTPIFSACPYILAAMFFGWHALLPVYFAVYVSLSTAQSFYYPNPRALNPSAAGSLTESFLFAYSSIFFNVVGGPFRSSETSQISDGWALSVSHLGFLFALRCGTWSNKHLSDGLTVTQLQFEARDLKALSQFFCLMFSVVSITHVVLVSKLFWNNTIMDSLNHELIFSFEGIRMGSFVLSITAWCLFTVWDMRRVNLTRVSLACTMFVALTGSVLVGPAAVLAGLWWWREGRLENGRQRNKESMKNKATFHRL